jgi:hypothetical protein
MDSLTLSIVWYSKNWIRFLPQVNREHSHESHRKRQPRYALTVLHTSQITIEHTKSSNSVAVFTSRCLVAAFSAGSSAFSELLNCPWPQLLACRSSCSQVLNRNVYLNQWFSTWKISKEVRENIVRGM